MLTQEYLKTIFHYDPLTGVFTRLVSTSNYVKVGDIATCMDNYGYYKIGIKGKRYKSHQLAFLYMLGYIPKMVDHKDQNKSNNKWDNLRETNKSGNESNTKKHKDNKSGYKGVSRTKENRSKPWLAAICINGKQTYIGHYSTPEEAARAYDKKALTYKGEFASLNFKQTEGISK